MNKVIDARAGDKWTKDRDGNLWLYRENENKCTMFNRRGEFSHRESYRFPYETDLPTHEAHAQLREWGYEVRDGDAPTGRLAAPTIEPPLTESRVREIVEEVLAAKAKPTPGEVVVHATPFPQRSNPAPASDPKTVWPDVNANNIKKWIDMAAEIAATNAAIAISKAPPPPDVSPEPDWRGLLEAVVEWGDQLYLKSEPLTAARQALSSARTNLAAKGGK